MINANSDLKHDGLVLTAEGSCDIQVSQKNNGVFEAFYNTVNKPMTIFSHSIELLAPGKINIGVSEVEFEFLLEARRGSEHELYEAYSGVFISINYFIKCDLKRKFLAKDSQGKVQFFVQNKPQKIDREVPVHFSISPETLQKSSKEKINIPRFLVTGIIDSTSVCITKPISGTITIQHTEMPVKSIEIQLVRVETCGCLEGFSRDATEIQNLQIADGNVSPKVQIPIYMQLPRLFTCPTLHTKNFKIQFELNLCVIFRDDYVITENFQLQIHRTQ